MNRKMLRRWQLLGFFAQLPACEVGMEACAGAHYWARELVELGHRVRLLPAQHVKPYVQGNKHDYNDARAIVAAMDRDQIHDVPIKQPWQQDIQAAHRLRRACVEERKALCNRLRGLLAEYGIVVPQGINTLRKRLPELLEQADRGLSEAFCRWLAQDYQRLQELDQHIAFYTREVSRLARQHAPCQQLQALPGFGPMVATAFYATVNDGQRYRRGRDVSASLGMVPRQHSSGGHTRLLGISKRGDRYLRSLLIHGARAVVRQAARKHDPLSRWINRLVAERGVNKASVALANKLARIGWALLRYQRPYQPA